MPDPTSHSFEMFTNPDIIIRELTYAVAYARERVIHGDWTAKYAVKAIGKAVTIAEDNLTGCGCTEIDLYANLSASGRATFRYYYLDRNGVVALGSGHPIACA